MKDNIQRIMYVHMYYTPAYSVEYNTHRAWVKGIWNEAESALMWTVNSEGPLSGTLWDAVEEIVIYSGLVYFAWRWL